MGVRKIKPRKLILIAAEGNNKTEENYFKQFNNTQDEYHINFTKSNYTDPQQMTNALLKMMKASGFNYKNGDRAYCVVDIDTDPSKARKIAELERRYNSQGIEYITSNPCFELWFLLHFQYTTKEFNNGSVIKELTKNVPNYKKNMNVFDKLYDKSVEAINNSKKLKKHHKNNGINGLSRCSNPLTDVYKIINLVYKDN